MIFTAPHGTWSLFDLLLFRLAKEIKEDWFFQKDTQTFLGLTHGTISCDFLTDVDVLRSNLESHSKKGGSQLCPTPGHSVFKEVHCSVQDGVALWKCGTASFSCVVFAGIYAPLRNTVFKIRQMKWWCFWWAVVWHHQGQKILMKNILNTINLYDLREKASFTLTHIQLTGSANTHTRAHPDGSFCNSWKHTKKKRISVLLLAWKHMSF